MFGSYILVFHIFGVILHAYLGAFITARCHENTYSSKEHDTHMNGSSNSSTSNIYVSSAAVIALIECRDACVFAVTEHNARTGDEELAHVDSRRRRAHDNMSK